MKPERIQDQLEGVPGWDRDGDVIRRTYRFPSFPAAIAFVGFVAEIAEAYEHHPDIDVRYDQVTLALTTHDADGLTAKDFQVARAIGGSAG